MRSGFLPETGGGILAHCSWPWQSRGGSYLCCDLSLAAAAAAAFLYRASEAAERAWWGSHCQFHITEPLKWSVTVRRPPARQFSEEPVPLLRATCLPSPLSGGEKSP